MIDDITKYEKNYSSRDGADGIIEVIFNQIGTTNKYFVEFGANGADNTTRLKTAGWSGLWMDGNGQGAVYKEWITAENIQSLFAKYKVPKEFDLLSIDLDSIDYWVWKAIIDYIPRVVIMEYNAHIPPDESRTVPNECMKWDATDYFGASLLALTSLSKSKGYSLIGCDSRGVNAYFVLSGLIKDNFVEKSVHEAFRLPQYGNSRSEWPFRGWAKSSKIMIHV